MTPVRLVPLLVALVLSAEAFAESPASKYTDSPLDFQWGVKIPLRDGTRLNATLYRPLDQHDPLPCVFVLTPYISQRFHHHAKYFATHGYVFLTVDVRGRGNSEGEFTPLLQEAHDGADVVEWLAHQKYCNGKIAMWGGSYSGYDQWATAKELPPHLATIVPVASPKPGVDFPPRMGNINYSFDMQWINLTSGRAAQNALYDDNEFWAAQFGKLYLNHRPFEELDRIAGSSSPTFQTWVAHPADDDYWESYNPSAQQFSKMELPILTITGQYDDDQPGAMSFYREHMAHASNLAKARHYLIIGPWDHAGTRNPTAEYGGLAFGPASLLDLNGLHKDWYDWTLKDGAKPPFLKNKVAYYMLGDGAGQWRYANSLGEITAEAQPMYLAAPNGSANDVFASGTLDSRRPSGISKPDRYIDDPLDTTFAVWDAMLGDLSLIDQKGLLAAAGRALVYHSEPFTQPTELAGSFKLSTWLALDQPDADIAAAVYEIKADGSSTLLTMQLLRARYRKSLRRASLVKPGDIERYDFEQFNFIAQRIAKGSRLRLVIGPANSRYLEKNYHAGGVVAEESGKDARSVSVTLYHDAAYPSALYLPIAVREVVADKHE